MLVSSELAACAEHSERVGAGGMTIPLHTLDADERNGYYLQHYLHFTVAISNTSFGPAPYCSEGFITLDKEGPYSKGFIN